MHFNKKNISSKNYILFNSSNIYNKEQRIFHHFVSILKDFICLL